MTASDCTKADLRLAALEDLIRREIAEQGPISFARFMEQALYHPEHGYYEQGCGQVGKGGDYYTSVTVGKVFGELLGFRFSEELAELGGGPLRLVEGGAHDGRLAADILAWMREWRPGVFGRMEYCILEPSPRRREIQRRRLSPFAGRVCWCRGWSELGSATIRGVVFANELLDALPFQRLAWDGQQRQWVEWGVALADRRFTWVKLPGPVQLGTATAGAVENVAVARLCASLSVPEPMRSLLPDGFTMDFSPAAVRWWSAAARSLAAGALVAIDYGLTTEEMLSPERAGGTARAYRDHQANDRLLEAPGKQDLTAHVNFSALRAAGEAAGLKTRALVSQERFLTQILEATQRREDAFPEWSLPRRRQLQTLIHPEHLGRSFRVLYQVRGGAGTCEGGS